MNRLNSPSSWLEKILGRFLTPQQLEVSLGDLEEKVLIDFY